MREKAVWEMWGGVGTRRETSTEGLDAAGQTTMDDEEDGLSMQGMEDTNRTSILWHTPCTYKLREDL